MIKIIFIAGAPGSGKSTIASLVAKKLGIHQAVSTDAIREILRSAIPKEKCPTLHTSAILACDDAPGGEDKMTWGFEEQARNVLPGIKAIVERSIKEKKDLILEGIHLIPGLVHIHNEDTLFRQFVLTVNSEEKHKIQLSGQGDSRSSYKISNFEKARAFQNLLIEKVHENKFIMIENDNIEHVVDMIQENM